MNIRDHFFSSVLCQVSSIFVVLLSYASADADVTATILETTGGVQVEVVGSLDLSALLPGIAGGGQSFVHFDVNSGNHQFHQTLLSGGGSADFYSTGNSTSITSIGSVPTVEVNGLLTTSNLGFWLGFRDVTSGSLNDGVYVTDNYVSGTPIDFSFFESGATLADFEVIEGDFWGVSIADSAGETQSITFNAVSVPEPSSLATLLLLSGVGVLRRRR